MNSSKLIAIVILVGALFTAGISQIRPASAAVVDRQSLKQQLLDKILSQEEGDGNTNGDRNEKSTSTGHATISDRTDSIKSTVEKLRDKILGEVGITLSKDEEKQVNQDDNKILSTHATSTHATNQAGPNKHYEAVGGRCSY